VKKRRIAPPEIFETDSSEWMLPYGNLMLLLMIFFLIMFMAIFYRPVQHLFMLAKYSHSFAKGEKRAGIEKSIKEMKFALKLYADEELKKVTEKMEFQHSRIRLVLKSAVLFESGKADLIVNAEKILDKLLPKLREIDNPIIVEGHTDNQPVKSGGRYSSNWELSAARAFSVIKYFIDKGINPQHLAAYGCGEYRPFEGMSNETEEGRSKNRRIEILIIRTSKSEEK